MQVYQKMFKLTSLSNWEQGNIGVAAVPESVKAQPDSPGPLGYFKLVAGLLINNPPTAKHAAQWECHEIFDPGNFWSARTEKSCRNRSHLAMNCPA